LRINIQKSQLLGVGVSRQVIEQAASSIGCPLCKINSVKRILKLLGLPGTSWIDDTTLRIKFPRLFALELDKDISVAVKMNSSVTQSFRRDPRGVCAEASLSLVGFGLSRLVVVSGVASLVFIASITFKD
nr:RNA-directed DNA polymerase, eukaryota [Tanacetum cinerariifolium]